MICLVVIATGVASASVEDEKPRKNDSGNGESSDVVEIDSTSIMEYAEQAEQGDIDISQEIQELETEIQKKPSQKPPVRPAQDENNSSISSFNFLYYLIDKFKFPDLMKESF